MVNSLNAQSSETPLGKGTPEEPYLIATLENLLWITESIDRLDNHYLQVKDIDATEVKDWTWTPSGSINQVGRGWIPIGFDVSKLPNYVSNAFNGVYDGNGKTISNINSIWQDSKVGTGLFSKIGESGIVKNLTISNLDVNGGFATGGLCGDNFGEILNVSVSGKIVGNPLGIDNNGFINVGGLVGRNDSGRIKNSNASVEVSGGGLQIGGLVGTNRLSGRIEGSYSKGTVNSFNNQNSSRIGGLAGSNSGVINYSFSTADVENVNSVTEVGGFIGRNRGIISQCFSSGRVQGGGYVGGFVGLFDSGGSIEPIIFYSYSLGNVIGQSHVGGFIGGGLGSEGAIRFNYSIGSVSGSGTNIGGFAGSADIGAASRNYWNSTLSNQSASAFGQPLTETQMRNSSNFQDWDFDSFWDQLTNSFSSYPFLRSISYAASEGGPGLPVYPGLKASSDPMILRFDLSLSAGNTISLPLNVQVDVLVDWGDGNLQQFTSSGMYEHTYNTSGVYEVKIYGSLERFGSGLDSYTGSDKLFEVKAFGDIGLKSLQGAFLGAKNLTKVPMSLPSSVTTVRSIFEGASIFNQDISGWDTENITDMSRMFMNATAFNQPIGSWDVRKVTTMSSMFRGASSFNADLENWEVGGVQTFLSMFTNAPSFEGIGLEKWRTPSVIDTRSMFSNASLFDANLESWDMSKVILANSMFLKAESFKGNGLSVWETSSFTDTRQMFADATSFDADLAGWDMSQVELANNMFNKAESFRGQGVSNWTTPNLKELSQMFFLATSFDADLGNWDVSGVESFKNLFWNASVFKGKGLSNWDVSNATDMDGMFAGAVAFDADLGTWNVEKVTSMRETFILAELFKGNGLSLWRPHLVSNFSSFLNSSGVSSSSYDQLLIAWSKLQLKSNVVFDAKSIYFLSDEAENSKSALINSFNWTITDAGRLQEDQSFNLLIDTRLSDGNKLSLPLFGNVDVSVDWGDGTTETINNAGLYEYIYNAEGTYDVKIFGELEQFGNGIIGYTGAEFITDVLSFGELGLQSLKGAFKGSAHLKQVPNSLPSTVTNLRSLFEGASIFNQDLSGWDTGNITDMSSMFNNASAFNQPIGNWDVRNVTTMSSMFARASSFNADLGLWDVSNVQSFDFMFFNAKAFEGTGLENWHTPSVTNTRSMFTGGDLFKADLGSWDVSKVTSMLDMFYGASLFDADLTLWEVGLVEDMSGMFYEASSFKGIGLDKWNISNVNDMSYMFYGASLFDSDLALWEVNNVNDMTEMFYNASSFKGIGIDNWNVSNVTTMSQMFNGASLFDADLTLWDVGQVKNMAAMFQRASAFKGKGLDKWNITSVIRPEPGTGLDGMLFESGLTSENYDALLIAWSKLNLQPNLRINAKPTQYSSGEASKARQSIIDDFSWTIIDGGMNSLYARGLGTEADPFQIETWEHLYNIRENLDAHYVLNNDLNETTEGYDEFVGGTKGWLPVGTSSEPFRGIFNGNRKQIQKLRSIRLTMEDVAMFSYLRDAKVFDLGLVDVDIHGSAFVGSLAARVQGNTQIQRVFSSGRVRAQFAFAGGFVASCEGSFPSPTPSLSDIYSLVSVEGGLGGTPGSSWSAFGGIAAMAPFSVIQRVYAAGTVNGQEDVGGVLGLTANHRISNSYWDVETSGVGAQGDTNGGAIGKTTAEMKDITIFTDAGWDFENVWQIKESSGGYISYPYLRGLEYDEPGTSPALSPIPGIEGDGAMELVFNTTFGDETTVSLPLHGEVDVVIDWGDGQTEAVTTPGIVTHDYGQNGEYLVKIQGSLSHFGMDIQASTSSLRDNFSLISVNSFGNLGITSLEGAFYGAIHLEAVPPYLPETVTNIRAIFQNALSFNSDISGWDVSNVTNMSRAFYMAHAFNQPIGEWDVSKVTNMGSMFYEARLFNADLSNWDVSNNATFFSMFAHAVNFEGIGLEFWEMSTAKSLRKMFMGASSFNADLSSWDVSTVTNMNELFRDATEFDSNLSSWDVSKVTNMGRVFEGASSFIGKGLDQWNVSSVNNFNLFLDEAGLTTENYDKLLLSWSQLTLQEDLVIHFGTTKYNAGEVEQARQFIIDNFNWTINDGGLIYSFAGGDGSEQNPYQIENWEHLNNVRFEMDAHFILNQDLDRNSEGYERFVKDIDGNLSNNGIGWLPLGHLPSLNSQDITKFMGSFDGNEKSISDLIYQNKNGAAQRVGLFAEINGASIVDLSIINALIENRDFNQGVLAGYCTDCLLSNINISGKLYGGGGRTGGLVGELRNSSPTVLTRIENSSVNLEVTGGVENGSGTTYIGGIVGYARFLGENSGIFNSIANVDILVYGGMHVGGVVGTSLDSQLESQLFNTSAKGQIVSIEGDFRDIGGLVGSSKGRILASNTEVSINGLASGTSSSNIGGLTGSHEGEVSSSSAIGDVTTLSSSVGGLIGVLKSNSTLSLCFAKGSVSGQNQVGGLLGQVDFGSGTTQISKSYAAGSVSGFGNQAGGFIGFLSSGNVIVKESYAKGNVTSGQFGGVGGFLGESNPGLGSTHSIHNSYSIGTVSRPNDSNNDYLGAFLGTIFGDGTLDFEYNYSVGSVVYVVGESPSNRGFIGKPSPRAQITFRSNFFDSNLSNQTTDESGVAEDITTTEMKDITIFADDGWDFDNTWQIKESSSGFISYPYLRAFEYDEPQLDPELNPIPGLFKIVPQFKNIATAVVREGSSPSNMVLDIDAIEKAEAEPDFNITYTISGVDAGAFSIDTESGLLNVVSPPVWIDNSDNVYELTVTASHVSGNISVQDLKIFVYPEVALGDNVSSYQLGNALLGRQAGDEFGHSISLSANGRIMAIGSENSDGNGVGSSAGQVRVFELNGQSWVQQGRDINGGAINNKLGSSISINADGTVLAVAAPQNSQVGTFSGQVRVFKYDSNSQTWLQLGSAINGDAAGDLLGRSVSINGDGSVLAVSARTNNGAGYVKIYKYINDNWLQVGSALRGNSGESAGLKISLNLDGSMIALSKPFFGKDGLTRLGLVQVYKNIHNNWVQVGQDLIGDNQFDDFGSAISLSANGSTLAVGTPFSDPNGISSGQVKIFRLNAQDQVWVQIGSNIDGDLEADYSGEVIELSADGSVIAIGARGDRIQSAEGTKNGRVRVYREFENDWILVGDDFYGVTEGDQAGKALSLSADGTTLAIGSIKNDDNGNNAGHVRVFKFDNLPEVIGLEITGEASTGSILTALYLYEDIDGDVESGTTFQWFRANANDGNGEVTITGATTANYTLTNDDLGKFIRVEVMPKNNKNSGSAENSGFFGPIKNNQIITFNPITNKIYGDAPFILNASINSDLEITFESSNPNVLSISGNTATIHKVGQVTITASQTGNDQYIAAQNVIQNVTINPASLTITADDKSKIYGSVNPALTLTYSGLVNGDTKVAAEPSIATIATVSSGVGSYPITLTGGSDTNYDITLVDGILEVNKASVTITADDQTKVYGSANPELTFTYAGLVNGDTKVATEPNIATIATVSSGVGSYPITLTGGSDTNYDITLVDGILEVNKASVTITADDKDKVYGSANPVLTFTYSGLLNGDTKVATEPSISTTATLNSGVGTYPIILTGGFDPNYEISLADGVLEVMKASLIITADDKNKVYGSANPELTFTYAGLVNGDTKVATEPNIATIATVSSGVGSYPITLTGGSDPNYEISLADGVLEVMKASLIITADDKDKVYGSANPELTFTYAGLVNGDTKVATEPSISTIAILNSGVGTYPITLTGGSDPNYDISLEEGLLEVTKASLIITADDKDKVYGSANPVLTFTYAGLVNGDTKVATEPSISTIAILNSGVGTYPITLTGGSDPNYDISLEEGLLEVTKASLIITADDKDKVYGSANPELTFTYAGLVNGDTKVATEPNIATIATVSSGVGSYPITLTGGSDPNYEISLEEGLLEVTKASLTITADDKDKVYGSANPELTFTYAGLVNGDTKVATEPSISTTATLSSGVGTYPIILTGGSDANYDITLVSGIITVQKRVLVIQVDNLEKYMGEEDPLLTFAIISGSLLEDDVIMGSLSRGMGEDVGTYTINIGSLSAGDNYELRIEGQPNFRINALEESKTLSIIEVIPIYLETDWGNENIVLDFPLNVMVKLSDNSLINLKVRWELTNLDEYIFKRGQYKISGSIELEQGIINTEGVLAQLFLEVLPKDPPVQIQLNPNEFKVGNQSYEKIQMIGEFTVIDPIDNIHVISLNGEALDNSYFQIQEGTLYWNSEDPLPGKTSFQISVNVLDRDGNEINELISINRIFAGLDEIEVKNTFTPNGDGINDDWGVIELRYYEKVKILVFEKSGKEVFETEDPNVFWDGTYKGKELAIGTYFWIIEVGETGEVRKGMLNLLRK